jgi:propanol-preferring alcohol dehydrogenase
MTSYRAVEVTGRRQFALVERERQEPAAGHVRLHVEACGICHTDVLAVEGMRADPDRPVVPGHEIVGTIEAVGAGVPERWRVGDRVGVGFLGGPDNACDQCRRGDFVHCTDQPWTGTHVDGGYAEVTYARASGLVRLPAGADPLAAAPLLCAGLTMYGALASVRARPGAVIGVQGIGGLGHLGIQFAAKMGFRVVALSRGADKEALAKELGAHVYIDTQVTPAAEGLQKLGGADLVLATAPHAETIASAVGGLKARGKLLIVAAPHEPMTVSVFPLLSGKTIAGWPSGNAIESEDTMRFSALTGVRPKVEVFKLEDAEQAFARVMENKVRFRAVLTP